MTDITQEEKLHDEKIIQYLFSILNLDDFQQFIFEQNSWYGYRTAYIDQTIKFKEEAVKNSNVLANDTLRENMSKIIELLDDFHNISAKSMFLEQNEYILLKDTDSRYRESEKKSEEINKITSEINNHLRSFLILLGKCNIQIKSQILGFKRN